MILPNEEVSRTKEDVYFNGIKQSTSPKKDIKFYSYRGKQ
jgi:hypothetical protein